MVGWLDSLLRRWLFLWMGTYPVALVSYTVLDALRFSRVYQFIISAYITWGVATYLNKRWDNAQRAGDDEVHLP